MPGLHDRIAADRKGASTPSSGFALIEVMIAMAILVIALGAITTTLISTTSLAESNRETILALEAADSALEAVKGTDFVEAFVSFNADPDDDPIVVGSAPGKFFAVQGLNLRRNDPDGFVGEIIFPGDGVQLLENEPDTVLGMPRDLNGDALITGADHAGLYYLLPVRVRVEWTGETGDRSLEMSTVITDI